MSLFDAFRYDGKRALVVGGATGMGAAVAELVQDAGAEVVVMDYADVTLPGVKAIHLNLGRRRRRSTPRSTSAAGRSHALFSCAGVADGTPGHREDQLHRPPPPDRPAARQGHARRGARDRLHLVGRRPRLGGEPRRAERVPRHPRLRRRREVGRDHGKADYMWSKQAICAYVAREALAFLKQGIRINAICPGPDRHAAGAGQQGHVARLRRRLPRRGGHRGRRRRWSRPTRSCSCAATPPSVDHRASR